MSLVSDIPRWFGDQDQQTADQVADLYSTLTLQMLGCPDPGRRNADSSPPL
jgi:hypothetical protein